MTKHTGADAWRENLNVTSSGAPKPLLSNAVIALRDSPAWQNVLSFDCLAHQTIIAGEPPWSTQLVWDPVAWTAHDDLLVTDWLNRQNIGVGTATAAQAVEMVARERSFHPIVEYLMNLEHDGKARTETWLSECLGAEQSEYTANIGRAMVIGAVARIFDPGCKVDTVPILEGRQGARKSTAIKTMFAPWFTDEMDDFGSRDAAMQTRGIWGIEVSELDAMNRGETAKIKAFISRTVDRYRPPYGHRVIESPRSCVFWGTTNSDDYLKDETGGRRFWPIKIGEIDIEKLAEIRDQLWAEAVVLYEAYSVALVTNGPGYTENRSKLVTTSIHGPTSPQSDRCQASNR
jgi:predicted P-loop ATPase